MKKRILLALVLAFCMMPTLALAVEGEAGSSLSEAWEEEPMTPEEPPAEAEPPADTLPEAWEQPPLDNEPWEDGLSLGYEPPQKDEPRAVVATPTSVIDGDMLLLYLDQYNTLLMLQVAVSVAAVIAILVATFSKEWIR